MHGVALLVFLFGAVISKLAIAAVVIYYLVPREDSCMICGERSLPLRASSWAQGFARLLRLQRRWCPGCGHVALARRPEPGGWDDGDASSERAAPSSPPAGRRSRPLAPASAPRPAPEVDPVPEPTRLAV